MCQLTPELGTLVDSSSSLLTEPRKLAALPSSNSEPPAQDPPVLPYNLTPKGGAASSSSRGPEPASGFAGPEPGPDTVVIEDKSFAARSPEKTQHEHLCGGQRTCIR